MPQIVQSGQLNIAALSVAGVYIAIVQPQPLINGVPTNRIGGVGVASWGPVNSAQSVGSYAQFAALFGNMKSRKYDLGTHVCNSYLQGTQQAAWYAVRVTDGTDVAASVAVQTNCMTFTSKYTGSGGNSQQVVIEAGNAPASKQVRVLTPLAGLPELFVNILQGVHALAATAGTTYTSVPSLSFTAAPAGGTNASANPTLAVYGTPTIGAAGTGYAANDFITLSNGVVVKVNAVSSGAITSFFVISTTGCNAGSIAGAGTAVPTNPVAQVSTTGSGTGATVNLTWGIGPATNIVSGSGYTVAPTVTLTGGGGTGGAYTATLSYWPNIVNAINLGQGSLRGPSLNMIAALGVGTSSPTNATLSLAGGTDGDNITSSALVGVDTLPRTGMYALRSLACSIGMLADCDDSTTWSTQATFGLGEGLYMIACGPLGDTISNAVSAKATAGIDNYAMKLMLGDWVYMLDTVNNVTRLVSPQGFVCGVLSNLSPNQSSLNKPIGSIVGTQKSATGVAYTNADLQTLVNAGIDVIANPIPQGTSFGCQNGHNTSSNPSIRGDNYTRMTNFIAQTLAVGMGIYVGTLSTSGQMRRAKTTLDSFFMNVRTAGLIGDPDNPSGPDPWKVTLDASNNPQNMLALGVEQASVKVIYQSVVEELVISIEGGQTVNISRTTLQLPPSGS